MTNSEIPNWQEKNQKLIRKFKAPNFLEAIDIINEISEIAEELEHHPDIALYNYNHLKIEIYTHSSNSLTEADFELAYSIEEMLSQMSS